MTKEEGILGMAAGWGQFGRWEIGADRALGFPWPTLDGCLGSAPSAHAGVAEEGVLKEAPAVEGNGRAF